MLFEWVSASRWVLQCGSARRSSSGSELVCGSVRHRLPRWLVWRSVRFRLQEVLPLVLPKTFPLAWRWVSGSLWGMGSV